MAEAADQSAIEKVRVVELVVGYSHQLSRPTKENVFKITISLNCCLMPMCNCTQNLLIVKSSNVSVGSSKPSCVKLNILKQAFNQFHDNRFKMKHQKQIDISSIRKY